MSKPCNIEIIVKRFKNQDIAIKKFIKKTKKEEIVKEVLNRRYFKSKSSIKNEARRKIKRLNKKNQEK
jgi:ribosomal protein S21